ncbi:MAG: NAD(P)/FAD-dependent oxidoreductase, partial [Pseudomonadota bacterium]|nr:NAD(P)/FAD-dependent oxidoreductase [Pseudomonadota bacterium]
NHCIDHVVLERDSIAERWRNGRWDSLVMNGPAWHDRFPALRFNSDPNGFPPKDEVTRYFEDFAKQIQAPIHCGVEVISTIARPDGGYQVETSNGNIHADHVIAATGPFQIPVIPPIVPDGAVNQMHSCDYQNPQQLQDGAVLVVGSGSSGAQIATELLGSGRKVYLSIGSHDRPPRSYRGKEFVWWLGALGKWQMKIPPVGKKHVTIAVSGVNGGETVDFRKLANRGMILLGRTEAYESGVISIADDLTKNITSGDANYLELLSEADAYIDLHGLHLPAEENARIIGPDPDCMKTPIRQIDLSQKGIKTIIWATGYRQDFSWLKVDVFDADGKPVHDRGVAKVDGIYFLGLPWLSMRGSSFIWGVWEDAKHLAAQITARS